MAMGYESLGFDPVVIGSFPVSGFSAVASVVVGSFPVSPVFVSVFSSPGVPGFTGLVFK